MIIASTFGIANAQKPVRDVGLAKSPGFGRIVGRDGMAATGMARGLGIQQKSGVRFGAGPTLSFLGKLSEKLGLTELWKEHQEWFPRQRVRLAVGLEAIRNKINQLVAGLMMAFSTMIPLPKWLYAKVGRDYFFSPRKVMGLKFTDDKLNEKILSHSFQMNPMSANLDTLHSLYLPPTEGKPTIVFSHGRDTNVGHLQRLFETADHNGYGFFAYDYPGFGKSDGIPSEQGLKDAGVAACRFLASDGYGKSNGIRVGYGIPYQQQILMGHSLGGGVAVDVARQFAINAADPSLKLFNKDGLESLRGQPQALVLANTFTSLKKLFSAQLERKGWLVAKIFNPERIKFGFESEDTIQGVSMPVRVFHCEQDSVVPFDLGVKLSKAAPEHRFEPLKTGSGHRIMGKQMQEILDRLKQPAFLKPSTEKSSCLKHAAEPPASLNQVA